MLHFSRYISGLLFSVTSLLLSAQSYNYIKYDVENGLAASTVYSMIQDRDGFMWFGTEAGLSRFDGTNFKTFTTKDGLPDNEILKIYEDSQGRIWMLPFRNAICYYYKGKFYNRDNDTVLKRIQFGQRPMNIFEDSAGTIWVNELNVLYKIYRDNRTERSETINGIRLKNTFLLDKDYKNRIWFSVFEKQWCTIYCISGNGTSIYSRDSTDLSTNELSFLHSQKFLRAGNDFYRIESDKYKKSDTIPFNSLLLFNTFSVINDSLVSFNTSRGAKLYNVKELRFEEVLMKDKAVSRIFRDTEGSWWLTTLGEGVFRLQPENFRNLEMNTAGNNYSDKSVYSFRKIDGKLYIGSSGFRLTNIDLPKLQLFTVKEVDQFRPYVKIMDMVRTDAKFILISDFGVMRLNSNFEKELITQMGFPKYVFPAGDTLYIATISNVIRFNCNTFSVIDTIWNGRSAAVFVKNDSVYIGTLGGLYLLPPGGKAIFMGEQHALLKDRITAIDASDDGSLWVATNDNGMIRLKDGRVYRHYTTEDGLPGDMCRTVFMDGSSVWVGTNKGIGRIDIADSSKAIVRITKMDGLNADFINKILVLGDTVFVATSEGVTYFNKNSLTTFSECRLKLLEAFSGNRLLDQGNIYTLSGRNLKISYAGISYKSAGGITYRYRLNRDDSRWQETKEATLEFVSLPYGEYNLEIVAENKFGVVSEPLLIRLVIPIPFWKTNAFYLLMTAVVILAASWIYRKRLNIVKQREKEKTALYKKAAEMELKALRTQMNPHFTFNVLNSIQYFIGYNDTVSAQRYLSKFSKLIRMTLDNSKNVFISLADEIRLLELYMDLEKMRFEDKFNYSISVDEKISPNQFLVPNMLLQPFIENSIKHGFKEDIANAELQVSFFDTGGSVDCTITDNGIGRKKAGEIMSVRDYEHKSAGLAMINDKIEALGYYYNYNMSAKVVDMLSADGRPTGTQIIIKMPKRSVSV